MYTYEFLYDDQIDGFGCIQFCANNKKEAEKLFDEWKEENGYDISNYTVKTVHNETDAYEYGKLYAG